MKAEGFFKGLGSAFRAVSTVWKFIAYPIFNERGEVGDSENNDGESTGWDVVPDEGGEGSPASQEVNPKMTMRARLRRR